MTPADRAIVAAAEERDRSPWFCAACGYALLNEVEWDKHTVWHRREKARAEFAAADAEAEAEFLRPIGSGR